MARQLTSGPGYGAIPVILATALPTAALEPVPIPSVDFEAHYDIWDTPAHAPMRALVLHSGGRYRMDRDVVGGLLRTTWFTRGGDASTTIILESAAARAVFRVTDLTGDPLFESWHKKSGTRVGEAEMLGERCVMWRLESDAMAAKRIDVCVTDDGVPLYAALARTPTIPFMRARHLQRRRQDPALFTLPSGIAPQDVPDLIALGRELTRKGFLPS